MILDVQDKKTAKRFFQLPAAIYRNDKAWISHPAADVEAVFDPARNSFFQHGRCRRWLLVNEQGEDIGRIAAFVDTRKTDQPDSSAGGIGFFECINNQNAANTLFQTAGSWLKEQGIKGMMGPINFGENDKYWGLLIEGFVEPSYGMNYNPPYYKQLFESFGFTKAYDQLTNMLDATKDMPERFTRISDRVMHKKEYQFRHFEYRHREKFFHDFCEIYNEAWKEFENFQPIDIHTLRESFRQLKPILDEKIIWFAYHENEPIAFIICVPDANQILKYLRGPMNLLNKLKFLWIRHARPISRLRIIVMGCKSRFQNRGIESALIRCLQIEVLPRNTIREVELAWVGDFNHKMIALHEATGAIRSKVHRTYYYLFPRE